MQKQQNNTTGEAVRPDNTQHTPGPWRIWRHMDPAEPRKIIGLSDDGICTLDEYNTNDAANARLIAAAPELLQALQACEDYLVARFGDDNWDGSTERPFALHNQIVTAIAKATGK